MTVLVGLKDPLALRLRRALLSCIIQPLTLLHRLFVVAHFVFVAFQSSMFVLYLGVRLKCIQLVDLRGYQHVASGVGDVVSLLPSPQFKLVVPCSSILQNWYPFILCCIHIFKRRRRQSSHGAGLPIRFVK